MRVCLTPIGVNRQVKWEEQPRGSLERFTKSRGYVLRLRTGYEPRHLKPGCIQHTWLVSKTRAGTEASVSNTGARRGGSVPPGRRGDQAGLLHPKPLKPFRFV